MKGKTELWKECEPLQESILEKRRALHRIPEVGTHLPKTAAYVAAALEELGIPYICSQTDSGILAYINGAEPSKCIAFRADMDALPIHEATGAAYASLHDGCMHACGHDAHTAMLLGAAEVLQKRRETLKGSVRLIFQTAEETAKGALSVLHNGWLDGVDAVFGMHIGTLIDRTAPAGTIFAPEGCCMASFDKFRIQVQGVGCHGSAPERGIDPINIAAHIVLALEAINAREFNACTPVVVTIGSVHGGSQYNVIPDSVILEGTIRCLEDSVRRTVARRVCEIASATAAVFGGSAASEIEWGAPPVVNDAGMAKLAANAAKTVAGEEKVITSLAAPNMGGEDFAYYLQEVPGAYLFLSSASERKKTDIAHHNPKFEIDEDVLWKGSALFVAIAELFLNE